MSIPLIVICSRTGNTLTVAHAICDALPRAVMVTPSELPKDLTDFNPVLLGFWRNHDEVPAEMLAVARELRGKSIGCFATMGGDPDGAEAKEWMAMVSRVLAEAGEKNRLVQTFLCRGRMDPAVLREMTALLSAESSETHPDRLDLAHAAELFRGTFGMNW